MINCYVITTLLLIDRLIAVGALLSTVTACGLIMIQAMLDHSYFENLDYSDYKLQSKYDSYSNVLESESCHNDMSGHYNEASNCTLRKDWFHEYNETIDANKGHERPACGICYPPATASGTFKAFASIMFAFAGASTFPTIQADMKEKKKFNMAAYIACISK